MRSLRACDIRAEGPIVRWDEAMPLGNGALGCLIWGASDALRFSVDCAGLWDTRCPPRDESFDYQNLVRLAREGKTEEIRRVFDGPYAQPTPTKLPAGKLVLRGIKNQPFSCEVNLYTAKACFKFCEGCVTVYLCADMPVGIICADKSMGHLALEVCAPAFQQDSSRAYA